jgi:outer membrane protein assembly factor BamB
MSSTAASTKAAPAALPPQAPRADRYYRRLFAWWFFLACISAGFWYSGVDRGIVYAEQHIAFVLGVLGLAMWLVRRSGLGRAVSWGAATTLCLMVAAFYLQFLPVKVVNDGDTGIVGLRWRWSEPDRQLDVPIKPAAASIEWQETPNDYRRFLGNGYWAEVKDVRLDSDWEAHPPRELWKQEIGAGWSGFAVVGDYAITQEQRGEQELVVCYEVPTGNVAWTYADSIRWDPNASGSLGGVGPRATPTVYEGKVFTQGATGIVNCFDARTGKLLWAHDTLNETKTPNIMWGKAGSPLVVDDRVVVSVGGAEENSLIAYNIADGKVAWSAGSRRSSYASPVLATLGGVRQILCVNEDYLTAHDAGDGRVLWEFPWRGGSDTNASCSQPVPIDDHRVFLSKGYGVGAALVDVKKDDAGKWTAEPVWENTAVMRTKLSNVVIRDGYVYGLSDGLLQCIELDIGKNRWKKRRMPAFGHGQIMLVGDVILALSESGELILAKATPEAYVELAKFPVLEGVTWNNPALSGNRLLVRNAEQAACLELPLREEQIATADK